MIEIRQLRRVFGDKVAVTGLDLDIPAGELFAFLGPNGAGKTTTIKTLVGLLQPTSGTVTLSGINIVDRPREVNALTGYVPDEPYLYEKLSGREFLQFVGEIYGLSGDSLALRIDEQCEQFRLGEFIDQLCETYSHGMKQRLVFASALLHHPKVLIVDEPMVGLDPRSMRMVKDLLQTKAKQGTTVFMSTHTLAVAEEIADRIGVITNGTLIFLGTVAHLREQLESDASLEQMFLALTEDESA